MNIQPSRQINIAVLISALIIAGSIVTVLIAAIAGEQLGDVVKAIGIVGVILVASLGVVALIVRFAAVPVTKIQTTLLERQREANRHEEKAWDKGLWRPGAGYILIDRQIAAPVEPPRVETPIDPRHALLVSLALLTIRTPKCGKNEYGPTSLRLMSADDAQSLGGPFADRMNWDAASKYGQTTLGLLFVQQGGKPNEQGLRIKQTEGTPTITVADLVEMLVHRNLILDSAVSALPGVER